MLEWLKQGVDIFNGMAAEETAELVASLQKAAGTHDIQKTEHVTEVVATVAETDIQKTEHPETIEKAEVVTDTAQPEGQIQKAEESTDISKALAPVMDVIKALQSQNEALAKSQQVLLEKINAMPVAPKGVLIEKALDTTSQSLQKEQQNMVEPVRKADGSIDDAATMLKQHYITAQPMQLNR